MKNIKKHEKGQALIVIAIGLIALFALVALSVDGNNIYSDRRHAQNAADTAVLAAARSFVRYPGNASEPQFEPAALTIAAANGYDNNTVTNSVVVSYPAIDLPANVPAADYDEYIEVTITSIIKLDFAPMIGTSEHTNVVYSVARVIPVKYSPLFGGHAGVALSTECNPQGSIIFGGSAGGVFNGSGFQSNAPSGCTGFKFNGNPDLTIPSICTAGGTIDTSPNLDYTGTGPGACSPVSSADFVKPNIVCTTTAAKTGNTLSPGNYTGTFPPSGVTYLESGTYCIHGDFTMHNGDSLIGDNVLIYMMDGGVSITGGDLHMTAPDSGEYKGLTMYLPEDNDSAVTINGNADGLFWYGTLLAPSSQVTMNGGSGSTVHGQIVGDTLKMDGGTGLEVFYDPNENWNPPNTPTVELVQ